MIRGLIGGVGKKGLIGPEPDEFECWAYDDSILDDDTTAENNDGTTAENNGDRASVVALLRARKSDTGTIETFKNVQELLAALKDDTWTTELLVVKRAENSMDRYSGDLALPGGKRNGSENGIHAAIREVYEEVGLKLSMDTHLLVGKLKDRETHNTIVSCYVFICLDADAASSPLKCDPTEIAHAWWVNVDQFWPVPRIEEVSFPIDKFSSIANQSHWRIGRKVFSVNKVFFPCFYLPAPTVAKLSEDQDRSLYCLWGFTFWMLNDLISCAGGERCLWLPPYFLFHSPMADIALVFFYWLYCALNDFLVKYTDKFSRSKLISGERAMGKLKEN